MFDALIAFLRNPGGYATPLPDADAAHLMGALMVRAAKADHAYLFEEIQLIDKVLAQRHGFDPLRAAKFRAECERLEADMPETDDMAQLLRGGIGQTECEATVRALWDVVYADGVKHDDEDKLLHQIEERLGVPPARALELQVAARTAHGG